MIHIHIHILVQKFVILTFRKSRVFRLIVVMSDNGWSSARGLISTISKLQFLGHKHFN